MSEQVDFSRCEKWHKCGIMHTDMDDVKEQLKAADTKRDHMEEAVGKIEGHLRVGNEKFIWIQRVGYFIVSAIMTLGIYIIDLSVKNHNRDSIQNVKLMEIGKDVQHIREIFTGVKDHTHEK